MQNLNDKLTHNDFTAELVSDKHGEFIMITQSDANLDGPCSVLLHPWQLRAVCENFGLVANDAPTQKTIAALTRRLLLLNNRIQHLDNWLRTLSDTKHADLNYEIGFSGGTADMAAEFCHDLLDAPCEVAPAPNAKDATKPTAAQATLI